MRRGASRGTCFRLSDFPTWFWHGRGRFIDDLDIRHIFNTSTRTRHSRQQRLISRHFDRQHFDTHFRHFHHCSIEPSYRRRTLLPVLFLWIFCPFLLLLLLFFFSLPVQRVRNGCPARLIYDGPSHFLIFVSFLFCLVWDFIEFVV